jgi:hypothetical protein
LSECFFLFINEKKNNDRNNLLNNFNSRGQILNQLLENIAEIKTTAVYYFSEKKVDYRDWISGEEEDGAAKVR